MPRPKQDLRRLTINLHPDMLEQIEQAARERRITTTRYIEQAIALKQFVETHQITSLKDVDGSQHHLVFM